MKTTSDRIVFEGGNTLLPELELVGWARVKAARTGALTAHTHPKVLEVFCLERGEAEWWVEQENHRLMAGDIYLNRPGELHGAVGSVLRPCAYTWLQVDIGPYCLPGMPAEHANALCTRLVASGVRRFAGSHELRTAFSSMFALHLRKKSPFTFLVRAQLHLLLALLAEELKAASEATQSASQYSYAIRRAIERIDSDPSEDWNIPELAAWVGLRSSQFNARFFSETGRTPADYRRWRRIELAKKRLRASKCSIVRLAHELGFSSSQHFAATFRRLEGTSPSHYRDTTR